MTDAALRELERRWRRSRAREDGLALLRGRVRAGDLREEQLELAALLGSPLALELLDRAPPVCGLSTRLGYLRNDDGRSARDRPPRADPALSSACSSS